MEKKGENKIEDKKSTLILECRNKLSLTGVMEVLSFDEEKIVLNTNLGKLSIKGQELKMNKLDVQNGDVIIVGRIASMIYGGKEIKNNKQSIVKRIFK
ncbi:MAG: sporulation protein YabP [Clostridium sp.]